MTKLERIAEKAGIEGDEYRQLLRTAIQERLRERGNKWAELDRVLEMRVAKSERSPETTPRPHQQRI